MACSHSEFWWVLWRLHPCEGVQLVEKWATVTLAQVIGWKRQVAERDMIVKELQCLLAVHWLKYCCIFCIQSQASLSRL